MILLKNLVLSTLFLKWRITIESSPMSIKEKLHNTLTNLISNTFIEDNRQEDLKEIYKKRKEKMFDWLNIQNNEQIR